MVTRKPHHLSPGSIIRYLVEHTVLIVPVLLLMAAGTWQMMDRQMPLSYASGDGTDASESLDISLPDVLSKHDKDLYRSIFTAQKNTDWASADAAIAQLDNRILLGHVLAKRYLNKQYEANADELDSWLDHYSDLPQAADIYNLALQKQPELRGDVPIIHKQAVLGGFGDSAAASLDSSNALWRAGLDAWRNGNKAEAARMFSAMARHEDSSSWMISASAYWAYRAYHTLGNDAEASRYLRLAADEPRSFYGILARKQLGEHLDLDAQPATLSDSDMLEMIGNQPIRRIVALTQAGFLDLAEQELRTLFPQSDDDEKHQLLALAHALHLSAVEISMAKQLGRGGKPIDYALYPIPSWKPEGGFTVDPSLIFALMRQESGFRASAVSPGGALGLMQLMPQTASLMQKDTPTSGNVTEPVANITLGQRYVQHLLSNNLVDGNLIYLLAAYNAGPAKLQDWKQTLGAGEDPLLFIESIPYAQTHNYVLQVMANYWIYSELSGHPSPTVHALLHGRWPSYDQRIAMAENGNSGS